MIYLDNASTTFPKPQIVSKAIFDFIQNVGANPTRGSYESSLQSDRILYLARKSLANMIGLKDFKRVLFTLNATMAINMVLNGILEQNDIVVTTQMEHNSVKRPLNYLKEKLNLTIEIPCNKFGEIDLKTAKEMMKHSKLLVCMHTNNVIGKIIDIDILSEIAKSSNTLFLLDVAQSIGIIPLEDIMQRNFLAISAHKALYAPMGIVALAISDSFDFSKLNSLILGGSGSVSESEFQPLFLPDKFESGTPNMLGIVCLKASLEWLKEVNIQNIYKHEQELKSILIYK
ncbi:aminotransferase class V-fold PLP-dependent enzyme [Helicobacter sp. MIT 14-3879]|uniref:aminotransferase class V-fold PLP-dependent enzyme n=1 Tax=Helicobacter sp. MIT 14-3879 TaxID=2040649 RepID=UPI002163973B|nr:aminotransferase class V-fold PLP-dependent enzyme [Helicobacter sp. MIT 14-3879]